MQVVTVVKRGVKMRKLTMNEICSVSGAESLDVTVVDPVAAAQTFLYLISVTDQSGFYYGSVVTGMCAGAVAGGYWGYGALAASGVLAGGAAGIVCAGIGTFAGGLLAKGAATFATGAYNILMS